MLVGRIRHDNGQKKGYGIEMFIAGDQVSCDINALPPLLRFQMDQQRSVDACKPYNYGILKCSEGNHQVVTHGGFIKNFDWGRIACAA